MWRRTFKMPEIKKIRQVVPAADALTNVFMNEVIGNKEDAASKTVDVASLVALIRQMMVDRVFQQQADETLSQDDPVSGTKYTVLDTTVNARIGSIQVSVTWTVQPDPLEIHLTIDGQAYIADLTNPVTATNYFVRREAATSSFDLDAADLSGYRAFLVEGRSMKIEAEITGGTVSKLSARVKYAKIP